MSDENGVAQLRSECDHLRSTNRQLQMEIEQLTMIHSKEKEESAPGSFSCPLNAAA